MRRSDDSSEKLRRHLESANLSLRIGVAVIGVAPLPTQGGDERAAVHAVHAATVPS